MADTLQLAVVTPERAVLEVRASSVRFTAHDGEIGILPRRAPLLTRVGVGSLEAATEEGPVRLFIDGGFAQMVDNKLTVLTEGAKKPEELIAAEAAEALEEAMAMPSDDQKAFDARQRAMARARAMRRLAP